MQGVATFSPYSINWPDQLSATFVFAVWRILCFIPDRLPFYCVSVRFLRFHADPVDDLFHDHHAEIDAG
jgi:hypothetical protein